MSTALACGHSLQAPLKRASLYLPRTSLLESGRRTSTRYNSSAATRTAEPESTPQSHQNVKVSRIRTERLDKVVGQEWTNKAKGLDSEIQKLGLELDKMFRYTRYTSKNLRSREYNVRTEPLSPGAPLNFSVEDGEVYVSKKKIPKMWLRDNCQCSSCMHDSTKQRLLDTFSIPENLSIKSHSMSNRNLRIEWSDGHRSVYKKTLLHQTTLPEEARAITRQGLTNMALWDASISSAPPQVIHTPDLNVKEILQNIRKYGFCYIDGVNPTDPATTEAVLTSISFIRETHYGGFYDFTADLASQDTAYTNIALEAHTDTTYFSDPAGLQAFHLLSHTDGEGGASLLVDGFKVAQELKDTDEEAYRILSTVNIHGHASGNEGISIQPYRGFPVLEHDPSTGDLLRVRWNSSDRAAIAMPIEDVDIWYNAARKFDALLKKKGNEYWEQLTPGRVLLFDNWRVLHGRSEFTGKRRICGGYLNRDDWISRYKMETLGQDAVLKALASG